MAKIKAPFQGKVDDVISIDDSDEESIFGTASDSAEDDDVLDRAKGMGLHLDEEEDEPRPLNIAKDIEEAEKNH